jgi:hypothetical protein
MIDMKEERGKATTSPDNRIRSSITIPLTDFAIQISQAGMTCAAGIRLSRREWKHTMATI